MLTSTSSVTSTAKAAVTGQNITTSHRHMTDRPAKENQKGRWEVLLTSTIIFSSIVIFSKSAE
jgi:hypothetical protein